MATRHQRAAVPGSARHGRPGRPGRLRGQHRGRPSRARRPDQHRAARARHGRLADLPRQRPAHRGRGRPAAAGRLFIRLVTPPGRRRLRSAADHRQHRDRRDRVQPGLRAEPDHRPGAVERPGRERPRPCRCPTSPAATSTPSASPARPSTTPRPGWSTSSPRPAAAGRCWPGSGSATARWPCAGSSRRPTAMPPTTSSAARWPWPTARSTSCSAATSATAAPTSARSSASRPRASGPIVSYVVPTAKQGGIWAPGGPVVGPWGTIYVAVRQRRPRSAPVRRQRLGHRAHARSSSGSASSRRRRWPRTTHDDLDLGSILARAAARRAHPAGRQERASATCSTPHHLGGVGGQLAEGQVCASFGGPAVSGSVVYVPCYGTGLTAVSVASGRVRVLLARPGHGQRLAGAGRRRGLGGRLEQRHPVRAQPGQRPGPPPDRPGLGRCRTSCRPSLSGSLVLVGTMNGVVAVSGA